MTEMVVDTPDDPEFLKQFARASMLHDHLDNTLKMFVRSFDGSTVEEALEYIGYQGAAQLRKRVAKLAREQLGQGEAFTMILGFMERCCEISERRNLLLHSPIGRERDGEAFLMRARGAGNTWIDLPKSEELKGLADDTFSLVQTMNHERLSGVIDLELRHAKARDPATPKQAPIATAPPRRRRYEPPIIRDPTPAAPPKPPAPDPQMPQEPGCDFCQNQGTLRNGRPCPACAGKQMRIPRDL